MFLEHDDIYEAGGHSHIQIGPKLIEPPGECRSNHDVLAALAGRLGAEHPGFGLTPGISPTRPCGPLRLGRPRPAGGGERWIDAQPDFAESHFLTGFGHPDGRFRFAPGLGGARAARGRHAGPARPLAGGRARPTPSTRSGWWRRRPGSSSTPPSPNSPESIRREGRPTCLIHPEDGGPPGDRHGRRGARSAMRAARCGCTPASLRASSPAIVVVESLWPSAAFASGGGINALIGAQPAAPNDGATFHDTAVWVRAA